ncbi:MAG: FmdB family zinc ribbon protein [Bacillota bacterium]
MPIYEYKCKDCEHKFSVLLPVTERAKVTCPKCLSDNVRREFSLFASRSGSANACSSSGSSG